MIEVVNARVVEVHLGIEDHGILTSYLTCEWGGGSRQGFGGYDLRHSYQAQEWLTNVLTVFGVTEWSKVRGQVCRIKRDGHSIVAIGHIIDERWFTPSEDFT